MGIPFQCACGYVGEHDAAQAGKLAPCPRCGELQRVGGAQQQGVRAERPTPPAWADKPAPPPRAENPYAPPGAASPYAPPQSAWSEPEGQDFRGPRRDLDHEAHVVAIGAWQQIAGVLLVCFGLFAGGMAVLTTAKRSGGSEFALAGVLLLFMCAIGVVMFLVGGGLRTMKNWARWVCGVLIGLQLLSQVVNVLFDPTAILGVFIGGAYNVALLWALFCQRANVLFSPDYQHTLRRVPGSPRWVASPFFWLPFVFCLLGCCLGGLLASAGSRF